MKNLYKFLFSMFLLTNICFALEPVSDTVDSIAAQIAMAEESLSLVRKDRPEHFPPTFDMNLNRVPPPFDNRLGYAEKHLARLKSTHDDSLENTFITLSEYYIALADADRDLAQWALDFAKAHSRTAAFLDAEQYPSSLVQQETEQYLEQRKLVKRYMNRALASFLKAVSYKEKFPNNTWLDEDLAETQRDSIKIIQEIKQFEETEEKTKKQKLEDSSNCEEVEVVTFSWMGETFTGPRGKVHEMANGDSVVANPSTPSYLKKVCKKQPW